MIHHNIEVKSTRIYLFTDGDVLLEQKGSRQMKPAVKITQ